jgi:copper(I)-binding protein
MINSISARLTFENARSFVQSQGYDVSQAVLTQSYVRSEVAISSSVTNYRLPIVVTDTTNGASAFNTERRVNLQDVHVVSSLFIGLAVPSSSTDAAFPVLSYPSTATGQLSSANADAAITGVSKVAGDRTPVTFTFAKASPITVSALIVNGEGIYKELKRSMPVVVGLPSPTP